MDGFRKVFFFVLISGVMAAQSLSLNAEVAAAALEQLDVSDPGIVVRLITNHQMVADGIYNPEDICAICQDHLGEDKANPVMSMHCFRGSTMRAKLHSFHARCLKNWWDAQIINNRLSCPVCQHGVDRALITSNHFFNCSNLYLIGDVGFNVFVAFGICFVLWLSFVLVRDTYLCSSGFKEHVFKNFKECPTLEDSKYLTGASFALAIVFPFWIMLTLKKGNCLLNCVRKYFSDSKAARIFDVGGVIEFRN